MPTDEQPDFPSQRREEEDPKEDARPIPMVVAVVTLAVVVAGVAYLLGSEPFGEMDLGDRRTIADLRPPATTDASKVDGQQLFAANCVACHQATGLGLPGVFPPLDGSEWVNGDERIVANILLHGIDGALTVKGMAFKGAMPSFARLGDRELAALASHVRGSWSNRSPPVEAKVFERERVASPRTTPFAGGDELKSIATVKR